MIENIINDLLSLEIKVIPVAILYFICLIPTEFRKQLKFKYTPIYCSLPILQHSRRLRDFHIGGCENTEEEIKRIRRDNRASFVIESMITPIIFGFIFGIFKVPKDVIQPLIVLLIAKRCIQFIKCVYNIKKEESLPSNKDYIILIVLYLLFICLYVENMMNGYTLGLQETSVILSSINEIVGYLIKSYLFAWVGVCVDVTSINFNSPYDDSDSELELAIDEE